MFYLKYESMNMQIKSYAEKGKYQMNRQWIEQLWTKPGPPVIIWTELGRVSGHMLGSAWGWWERENRKWFLEDMAKKSWQGIKSSLLKWDETEGGAWVETLPVNVDKRLIACEWIRHSLSQENGLFIMEGVDEMGGDADVAQGEERKILFFLNPF